MCKTYFFKSSPKDIFIDLEREVERVRNIDVRDKH